MKLATIAHMTAPAVASVAVPPASVAATSAGNSDSRVIELRQKVQAVGVDIHALQTARRVHNRETFFAVFGKLRADWAALPPALKERLAENHPTIAKVMDGIKTLRVDIEVVKTAYQNQDKVAVEAALANVKTDLDALPPVLRALIDEQHTALAKLLN